jgi:hypothetical protein
MKGSVEKMIKCWNCRTEIEEPVSSARKIENKTQPIDTSPPWWNGNVAIDFSPNEWEYVVNGLASLIESAHVWGWADTAVETDIRNIIDRIEKNIGVE